MSSGLDRGMECSEKLSGLIRWIADVRAISFHVNAKDHPFSDLGLCKSRKGPSNRYDILSIYFYF